jgi:hypothetical protein
LNWIKLIELFWLLLLIFCAFVCAVPKKKSDEQPQYKEPQQQSKSSASDKQFNKEHLEAVKRYSLICCVSEINNSHRRLAVIFMNKPQIPKELD